MAINKDIADKLKADPGLKKTRELMSVYFPDAVWWYFPKLTTSGPALKLGESVTVALWGHHRRRTGSWTRMAALARKQLVGDKISGTHYPTRWSGGVWGMPLHYLEHHLGYFVMSGIRPKEEAMLPALEQLIRCSIESFWKTEEINRLSATIRPRAIALSTVHTVHRIINSTLNLDELISRLAHLTAQVLRVSRCSIYLMEPAVGRVSAPASSANRARLICKALVGFSQKDLVGKSIALGSGLEGRVAKSADIQLRKKVLCIPLIDEDVIGVVTVTGKKDKKDFNHFDLEILTTLAEEAVIAIKNAHLYEEQRRVTLNTIHSLALILGSRLPQHSLFTPQIFAQMALRTAEELRLSEEQMQALHYAALLKETAKLGIPEEILKKPEKLTHEELNKLRHHPIHGAQLVENFESLKNVAPIILHSREKFDGSGYPEGLKGEAIPVGARILSVLNAYEAIVVGRPYRGKLSETEAISELEQNRGSQFDPKIVEAFLRVLKKENFLKRLSHVSKSQ